MSTSSAAYPLRLEGALDAAPSRWLWLVKWLLVLPHVAVLALLWIGVAFSTAFALVAILVTGRYPRALFRYNAGVLRWSWRVGFYACNGLATDRYPPFRLADDAGYPARLEIDEPAALSRGQVLVKWWLLALPHYLVICVFEGLAWSTAADTSNGLGVGLIGLLVLCAAVVLLATGRYPRSVFDFVMGMNRWVFRVAAYSLLMTDVYPPFRLDMGGSEPPTAGPTVARAPVPAAGA